MDLVSGVRRVVVLMEHTAPDGVPKLLQRCTLPLTGANVVHRVITNLGVFEVCSEGFVLIELAPGVSVQDVQTNSGAPIALISTSKKEASQ